jgi:hypothetical protein
MGSRRNVKVHKVKVVLEFLVGIGWNAHTSQWKHTEGDGPWADGACGGGESGDEFDGQTHRPDCCVDL